MKVLVEDSNPGLTKRVASTKALKEVLLIAGGLTSLALLSHLKIGLSFSPVPLTGQTYGVALIALSSPVRRSVSTVAAYLFLGLCGMPVFAQTQLPWHWGPTAGYLLGMLVSSYVVSKLASRMPRLTFLRTVLLGFLSSYIIFAFGLLGLAFFIDRNQLLRQGYLPFIRGDCVKVFAAAMTTSFVRESWSKF